MRMNNISLDLIVYGLGEKFIKEKMQPVKNKFWVKPNGGLWTSPIESKFGWKQWCEAQDFGYLTTSFQVKFNGDAYQIDTNTDFDALPMKDQGNFLLPAYYLDFEKIASFGIDAIWLTYDGQRKTRFCTPNLYGWDCECVFVMNSKSIK